MNRGEFVTFEDAAVEAKAGKHGIEWRDRNGVDGVAGAEEFQKFPDRRQLAGDPLRVAGGAPRPDPLGTQKSRGISSHQIEYSAELQHRQRRGNCPFR
jgi:hypothetical protein